MLKKPKKFGIKLWSCELDSRYCLLFQVYRGKAKNGQEQGLAYCVVTDLTESCKLLQYLEKKSTYICGKVRQDCGMFLLDIYQSKLSHGERKYLKLGNMLLFTGLTKGSTLHGTGNVLVKRKGDEESFDKPVMINEYNKQMGDVDQCDQLLNMYVIN